MKKQPGGLLLALFFSRLVSLSPQCYPPVLLITFRVDLICNARRSLTAGAEATE
jgi:hypothetical protein